jgi:hypothetical protein
MTPEKTVEEIVDNLPYHTENTPGTVSNIRYYTKDTVVKALQAERQRCEEVVEKFRSMREIHEADKTGDRISQECFWLHQELQKAREEEKNKALLVMNEFVQEKGEDYPLGKYLNMLCALSELDQPTYREPTAEEDEIIRNY